jgi:hypothetical protein
VTGDDRDGLASHGPYARDPGARATAAILPARSRFHEPAKTSYAETSGTLASALAQGRLLGQDARGRTRSLQRSRRSCLRQQDHQDQYSRLQRPDPGDQRRSDPTQLTPAPRSGPAGPGGGTGLAPIVRPNGPFEWDRDGNASLDFATGGEIALSAALAGRLLRPWLAASIAGGAEPHRNPSIVRGGCSTVRRPAR